MNKLPIGIQTFSKLRQEECIYVDKTKIAHQLIESGSYYFLSRPRRFGKSLFLDTLKELFEGNKSLFKGLYIENKWNFEQSYPVIYIDFAKGHFGDIAAIKKSIRDGLERTERRFNYFVETDDATDCLQKLIWYAKDTFRQDVVILVDEYDKPILDNITDESKAVAARNELKALYSVIKHNDQNLKFVMLTGVSKFSKINLFSGLNNLNDITLDSRYGEICGYTQNDLEISFADYMEGVDRNKLKEWYNGYNYFAAPVYNPFDILLFFDKNKEYLNYWWSTGNPQFLLDLMEVRNYSIPSIQNFIATDTALDSFDVHSIELEPLLWQTGYLTIKNKSEESFGITYTLQPPNKEVQVSLNNLFVNFLSAHRVDERIINQIKLNQILKEGSVEKLEEAFFTLFASIPYHNFTNNKIADYEGYYASVVYAYLASLGHEIIAEDISNKSRVDLALKVDQKVYLFEFKVTKKATGNALKQIKDRRYFEKYQTAAELYLIGIEFGKKERNILNFVWEKVK